MSATAVEHRYVPRGTARDLFACRAPEVLMSGPAGTGKSRACLEKLHLLMLVNPGARGLILRKTQVSLGSTALNTWRKHVVPEALTAGILWFYGGSSEEPAQYRYANGSSVAIGGMDNPTKIMSSEYDVIYIQEAIELTVTDWENATTRLRNGVISFQQLIADTNPDTPHHWLKARCDAGTTLLMESRHEDNPLLFDDQGRMTEVGAAYMSKLDALTGVRFYRLRKGLWVAAEGIVYEEWDARAHLVDWFRPPDDWPRFWSVDFGYTNPFVCQWWAEDPDGRLYLYREIYRTKRLVEDHARDILKLVTDAKGNWIEPRPTAIICDHDAEDRATLRKHLGLATIPAKKDVSPGIQAVQSRLKRAGDGRPRLFLMRDAVVERDQELVDAGRPACTAEEVVSYVWDITPAMVRAGKAPKEQPRKEDDHGMDAARYVVADRDLRREARVRFA
jgi:PBSX family phage terminase large subunit